MKAYKFKKEVLDGKFFDEPRQHREHRIYEVSESDFVLGKLIYRYNYAEILIGESSTIINRKRNWFKNDRIELINVETNGVIGKVTDLGAQLYNRNGKYRLEIGTRTYQFDRKRSTVKYSILKKSTWNWFRLELENHEELTTYIFQIAPSYSLSKTIPTSEFSGEILSNAEGMLNILIGLYLTELYLEELHRS